MARFATHFIAVMIAGLASAIGLADSPQVENAHKFAVQPNGVFAPEGYTTICRYGESCALLKPSLVAYGSDGQYLYKVLKGAFLCNERSFNRLPANTANAHCSIANLEAKKATAQTTISANELTNGTYAIISVHSGKAIEVSKNGEITQAPYSGLDSQHLILSKLDDGYFTIETQDHSALEVKDWDINDGAQISTAAPVESWSQQWRIENTESGYVSITSRYNAKALDLYGMNTHNSAKIRLWTFWGGQNQQWKLVPISSNADAISF